MKKYKKYLIDDKVEKVKNKNKNKKHNNGNKNKFGGNKKNK